MRIPVEVEVLYEKNCHSMFVYGLTYDDKLWPLRNQRIREPLKVSGLLTMFL